MTIFSLAIIFFLIMDPLGSVSSYLYMVETIPHRRQTWVVIREMLIALLCMLIFNFFGEFFFDILDLSQTTLRLAAGMILLLIALKILFASPNNPRANLPKEEPFIIPLAVPLIAGPSLLATIMLYAHLEPSIFNMLAAIFIAWFASAIVLLFARPIHRVLGQNGLIAIERLMAMVLIMLAIQRICEGIQDFVAYSAAIN